MTDEELISTLWCGEVTLSTVAAAAVRIEQLSAKLAKAMDALREIKSFECAYCTDIFNELADAVLDGTKGET